MVGSVLEPEKFRTTHDRQRRSYQMSHELAQFVVYWLMLNTVYKECSPCRHMCSVCLLPVQPAHGFFKLSREPLSTQRSLNRFR